MFSIVLHKANGKELISIIALVMNFPIACFHAAVTVALWSSVIWRGRVILFKSILRATCPGKDWTLCNLKIYTGDLVRLAPILMYEYLTSGLSKGLQCQT